MIEMPHVIDMGPALGEPFEQGPCNLSHLTHWRIYFSFVETTTVSHGSPQYWRNLGIFELGFKT
jgi:hypothetical protein